MTYSHFVFSNLKNYFVLSHDDIFKSILGQNLTFYNLNAVEIFVLLGPTVGLYYIFSQS